MFRRSLERCADRSKCAFVLEDVGKVPTPCLPMESYDQLDDQYKQPRSPKNHVATYSSQHHCIHKQTLTQLVQSQNHCPPAVALVKLGALYPPVAYAICTGLYRCGRQLSLRRFCRVTNLETHRLNDPRSFLKYSFSKNLYLSTI